MIRKGITAAVLAVALVLVVATTAFAASIGMGEARSYARKEARASAARVGADRYEVGSCSRRTSATVVCSYYVYGTSRGFDCDGLIRITATSSTSYTHRAYAVDCY